MDEPVLLIEKNDGVAIVTMNRPRVMNALSGALRVALRRTFLELSDDPETKVAILTGAGKAFCGGLDLKEFAAKGVGGGAGVVQALGDNFFIDRDRFQKPLIGAINGPAVTGGFELALVCDILIASTQASFADTHARVGIMPGAGMSQKLSRLIGPGRAKEMSLTGNFIAADRAEAWGLVNRVVRPEELMSTCLALARDINSCAAGMVEKYRRLIDEGFGLPYSEALKLEAKAFFEHLSNFSAEAVVARRAEVRERGREQKNKLD